MKQLLPIEPTL